MKIKLFTPLLFLLITVSGNGNHDQASMESGDLLFTQMKYGEAILAYQKYPQDAIAQWKIARAYICIADTVSIDDKLKYINAGETASRNSIRLNPNLSEGYTWLAASLGNKAMFEGSKTKVKLCNEIKAALDKALELDPKNDLAYSILGSFHRAIGKITWLERQLAEVFLGTIPAGGFSQGEIALKKAIILSPKTVRHYYELGNLYKDWGKEEKAKEIFRNGVKLTALVQSDYRRLREMKSFLE